MGVLQNKIDFIVLAKVENANPNGDPLNGNRPRTTYSGFGEISDVCIKRKIRNRLQDMGNDIFVKSDDRNTDGYKSLKERAYNEIKSTDKEQYAKEACSKWIDVRSFGQVFAFSSSKKDSKNKSGVSVGVRGPVSIHQAKSISPVDINSMQITKSVNGESDEGMSSDRIGTKHFIEFGLYEIKGSINVQLSEKTQFTEEDAKIIKEALKTLFINDSSSARPDGSMEVCKVYWWTHNNKIGQYSSAKVHNSLEITIKEGIITPTSIDDYNITRHELEGLFCEEIEGI